MKLSICIPTFNRSKHLRNCLESIRTSFSKYQEDYQVCISNNASSDETEKIVNEYSDWLPIKYNVNLLNVGVARNVLKVTEMAEGEFVWLLGDDDLVMPGAIDELINLLNFVKEVDYFYINSYHLTTDYVHSFSQPFQLDNLPENMVPFSSWKKRGKLAFLELIDPKISFDFLGGMFLAVFKKEKWDNNLSVLNEKELMSEKTFSHFDNTFVHVKVFSHAFANSMAYFYEKPLSVCLTGAREWAPMYSMVRSVRLIEALDEYRKNGLSFVKYIYCKNYALENFIPDMVYILFYRNISGWEFISPVKLIFSNCLYPNFYLSFFYYIVRKLKQFFKK